jgi:hypothetical protein
MDKVRFDRSDYSVVVKNRAPLPNSWKWEIYRAGRSSPIKQSSVYFHSVATANRAGKEALKQLTLGLGRKRRRFCLPQRILPKRTIGNKRLSLDQPILKDCPQQRL